MTDTSNLWKAGFSLLAAGAVLKMTKQFSDKIAEEKKPKKENKRRYFRL